MPKACVSLQPNAALGGPFVYSVGLWRLLMQNSESPGVDLSGAGPRLRAHSGSLLGGCGARVSFTGPHEGVCWFTWPAFLILLPCAVHPYLCVLPPLSMPYVVRATGPG